MAKKGGPCECVCGCVQSLVRRTALSRLADYDRDTLVGGRRRHAFAHSRRSHFSRTYIAHTCWLCGFILMVCVFARSESFECRLRRSIASVESVGRGRWSKASVVGVVRGRCVERDTNTYVTILCAGCRSSASSKNSRSGERTRANAARGSLEPWARALSLRLSSLVQRDRDCLRSCQFSRSQKGANRVEWAVRTWASARSVGCVASCVALVARFALIVDTST